MDQQQTIADLDAQIEWYGKLLRLAELQHTLVEQERTDDLLVVLEKRQVIVNAIGAIEARLKPTKLNWSATAAELPGEVRSQIEARFARSRELLEQITRSDQDDALLLQQRKISVGQQLRRTNTGQQLNRGYATTAYRGAIGGRMDVSR